MAFQPINLGNTLLQAEKINALRDQRNPNSLRNQLLRAKLDVVQSSPGGIPSYGKSPVFVRDAQGNIKAFQLSDRGGAQEVDFGDGAMPAIRGTWKDIGRGIQFLDPYGPPRS